ncbi:LamG-like jellyroll fold domain-containing protein [Actinoplanes teichomyceticus]|uniref:Concanavalin A-like lectin/glucanase superfamily protein n=1 Tax=Actinoplanes teichomyceticus TaxID=1867 RepID=A0A561WSL4_ACTTI|nr:LamG-like jellyroll fold domain-containing protein [Actinoplanes teichomyceticus]TWG26859.1 concanavalin A-like lectin/glucanase superfamily protein [Actinoplanes teichomyceticus]
MQSGLSALLMATLGVVAPPAQPGLAAVPGRPAVEPAPGRPAVGPAPARPTVEPARWPAGSVAAALAVEVMPARPADAGRPDEPPPVTIVRYTFNGRAGSILNESGLGHALRIISGHGGRVRPVVHGPGTALAFPPHCDAAVCPHVALQAPNSADLNPGTRNLAYGAEVLLSPRSTSKGQNVVQKGYSKTSSQYKLQIDGAAGQPSCVLVDRRRPGIRIVRSSVSAADSRWHSVRCERVGVRFEIYVDDVVRGRTRVPAGLSVANNRPLSIGGKGAFQDNDQFNGVLDNVWVRIG